MTRREVIAAAIANARGMRRGAPPISNVLEILPPKIKAEVLDDAEAVEKAIDALQTQSIDEKNASALQSLAAVKKAFKRSGLR